MAAILASTFGAPSRHTLSLSGLYRARGRLILYQMGLSSVFWEVLFEHYNYLRQVFQSLSLPHPSSIGSSRRKKCQLWVDHLVLEVLEGPYR